jgi:hypothetical protein
LTCEKRNTIQIDNGYIRTPNNSIIHRNITYDKAHWGYDENHGLRVCLCDYVSCIRLCCALGEVMIDGECTPYNGTFSLNTKIKYSFDGNPIFINLAEEEYRKQLVYGIDCTGDVLESEKDDDWILHEVSISYN